MVAAYPEAGVEVFRVPVGSGKRSLEDRKTALKTAPDVRFAGGVLIDPKSREPVLYTENLFVKFIDTADGDACRDVLRAAGLTIKEKPSYATNPFFVEGPQSNGPQVFDLARDLIPRADDGYWHPEPIRPR